MPLSWIDIKSNAAHFIREWKDEINEDAEAKSFWDDFFSVFGVKRRRLASFEYHVKKLNNKNGFVDLFWPGTLIVEHKSKGKSLDKAHGQVLDYFHGIPDKELPKYILVSDFANFRLYDLDENSEIQFPLTDLLNHIHLFGFIANYQKRVYKEQDPVNIKAAEVMGKLHDKLKEIGYSGHQLEVYLVRLLFCLFADDTGIFEEKGIFNEYIEFKTSEDGNDLAARLAELFQVLNTPLDKRYKNIDDTLNSFPYVNGKLFEENLQLASFDRGMRKVLLDCCMLDWGKISPAIFGSLFQSVMDARKRRDLGAHYTSEKNILKVIKPLFLDDLWSEFEKVKGLIQKDQLLKFHSKISKLHFLDPACGCGNFLIIAYRELRLLEIEIIKVLLFKHEKLRPEVAAEAGYNIGLLVKCDVDKFYGIEYEEFPAQIAQVAMWLIDHQMNQLITQTFGEYYVRLPLRKSATILHANALHVDWSGFGNRTDKVKFDFVLGNPPFIGQHLMSDEQKADIVQVFKGVKSSGVLDYVTAWYVKAAQYMRVNSSTKTAFVSTSSITQGEQVGTLWHELYHKYKVKIHFAHRTFKWGNEAKGNAAVHVVIICFANFDISSKRIYEYDSVDSEPHEVKVKNINPYLFEGRDFYLLSRSKPINKVPDIKRGNSPYDGGHFLFNDEEYKSFIAYEPSSKKFFRKFLGAKEFINNTPKWCLWLKDAEPSDLKSMPKVMEVIRKVKEFRLSSPGKETQSYAITPALFRDKNNPLSFIVIPRHSSENRTYIPNGFFDNKYIAGDSCMILPEASLYHFGIITSLMHMVWVKYVCGRLESRYRYSKDIVYNNFPWPEAPAEKQVKSVEEAASDVLAARKLFPDSSLADLYEPNTMPFELLKAHQALDNAVDKCYTNKTFTAEGQRIEFLFDLYDKYISHLFASKNDKKVVI